MSQRDDEQFLSLYQTYRYEDQLKFYQHRRAEFSAANTQAVNISIGLIFLSAVAAGVATYIDLPWLRLIFLLVAAISPILSTALAGYSALYGFEQQAKLYQDTVDNLLRIHTFELDSSDTRFSEALDDYVHEVEKTFLVEQGQWGQLAREMKPPE